MQQESGETVEQATTSHVGVWTVAGLAIALLGPPFLASEPMQAIYALAGSGTGASFVGQSFLWFVLAGALACLVYGERLPLSSVSIVSPTPRSLLGGLAVGVGVYAVLLAAVATLTQFDLFNADATANIVHGWPLWLRVFVVVTAGVVEEALYRGYAIERLTALTGRRWLAATIALVAFTVAHLPFWGLGAVATPLIGGGFFTLVYLWRRDLVACMVAHCLIDLVGLVIAPALV